LLKTPVIKQLSPVSDILLQKNILFIIQFWRLI